MATVTVTALDHLYVTVADLRRSEAFYDPIMRLLGFRKGTLPIGGAPHVHYFNRVTQYSLRPARIAEGHDPYRPGLHHVCFRLPTPADVDAATRGLAALGVDATPPRLYPEYAADYYATFFTDPDGIRLELVAHRRLRSLIHDHWDELTEFEDPLRKAGLL
jgi:catechol 2,3-dioxygenase-like lactoylglutathione lyase family enzyme